MAGSRAGPAIHQPIESRYQHHTQAVLTTSQSGGGDNLPQPTIAEVRREYEHHMRMKATQLDNIFWECKRLYDMWYEKRQ